MNLTEEQRQRVTAWILEGAKLSEIQSRLDAEFGIRLTYMDTHFLVDDLKLVPKDHDRPKVVEPHAAPKPPEAGRPAQPDAGLAGDEPPQPAAGRATVSVSVDKITRPGSLVSGNVTFSDGQMADWYLDQMGRLGLAPRQQGYKPATSDLQEFQIALQQEMAKLGY